MGVFRLNGGDSSADGVFSNYPFPYASFSFLQPLVLAPAASPPSSQVHHSPGRPENRCVTRQGAHQRDQYAWDITEGLTTEVGPRLAGTEAEAGARDWAVRKLQGDGLRQRSGRAVRHARLGSRL